MVRPENFLIGWGVAPTEKVSLIIKWHTKGYSIDKILSLKTCVFNRQQVIDIIEMHDKVWSKTKPIFITLNGLVAQLHVDLRS